MTKVPEFVVYLEVIPNIPIFRGAGDSHKGATSVCAELI